MNTVLFLGGTAVAVFVLYLGSIRVLRPYLRLRGTRVVNCPDNQRPAAVELDAAHAALTSSLWRPSLRLEQCSRWPEKAGCGQACLQQVEASPEDCLVRTILTRWYDGKTCGFCGKSLGTIDWGQHRPALLAPSGKTFEWSEIDAVTLAETLATHRAVCWNCHVAETFRRQRPDLVIDNPFSGEPVRK
jgi:hypothetical protein